MCIAASKAAAIVASKVAAIVVAAIIAAAAAIVTTIAAAKLALFACTRGRAGGSTPESLHRRSTPIKAPSRKRRPLRLWGITLRLWGPQAWLLRRSGRRQAGVARGSILQLPVRWPHPCGPRPCGIPAQALRKPCGLRHGHLPVLVWTGREVVVVMHRRHLGLGGGQRPRALCQLLDARLRGGALEGHVIL